MLPAQLPVRVVEQWGSWSRVECDNGWTGWVDGRTLTPLAGDATALDLSPVRVGHVQLSAPLVGAAVAAVAAFLPWVSTGPISTGALDLPVSFLFDNETTDTGGFKIGWLVLLLAAAALASCLRPGVVPPQAARALGWALVLIATVYVAELQRSVGTLQTASVFSFIGLGVYAALVAGLLIALGKAPATSAA